TKGYHSLLEPTHGYLRPKLVQRRRALVPEPQKLRFRQLRRELLLRPVAGDDPTDHWLRHLQHLLRESSVGPHRAYGESEELVLREGLDHSAAETPVPLPVVEQLIGRDDGGVVDLADVAHVSSQWRFG